MIVNVFSLALTDALVSPDFFTSLSSHATQLIPDLAIQLLMWLSYSKTVNA